MTITEQLQARIAELEAELQNSGEILRQRIKHLEMALNDRNTETAQQQEIIDDLQSRLNTMTSKHALQVDATDDLRQRVAALEADYDRRQGDGR